MMLGCEFLSIKSNIYKLFLTPFFLKHIFAF